MDKSNVGFIRNIMPLNHVSRFGATGTAEPKNSVVKRAGARAIFRMGDHTGKFFQKNCSGPKREHISGVRFWGDSRTRTHLGRARYGTNPCACGQSGQ